MNVVMRTWRFRGNLPPFNLLPLFPTSYHSFDVKLRLLKYLRKVLYQIQMC